MISKPPVRYVPKSLRSTEMMVWRPAQSEGQKTFPPPGTFTPTPTP